MKHLDFLIIGAQKSATTTLFEQLRAHPKVNMPLEKEVPFFTRDDCSADSWADFAQAHFGTDENQLWGKATPQYMCDPRAAQRIHALMPQIRLVAILRDPIERTWSHYQMGRRRETEARPFDQVVAELLGEDSLQRSRQLPVPEHARGYESESDFYVTWSEYGRVLASYAELFGPDQLLVLYTEDLRLHPEATLDKLLAFIGLQSGFRPDTLGQVVHQGGGSNRIPHALRVRLREQRLLYRLWQMLPESRRGRLRFQYEQWNVKKQPSGKEDMPGGAREALRFHFRADLQTLLGLPVDPPPWAGRYLS